MVSKMGCAPREIPLFAQKSASVGMTPASSVHLSLSIWREASPPGLYTSSMAASDFFLR